MAALDLFLGTGVMDHLESLGVLLGQHLLSLSIANSLMDIMFQLIVFNLLTTAAGWLTINVFSPDYFFEAFLYPRFLMTLTPIKFRDL